MGINPSWFNGVRQVWDDESETEIDVDYAIDTTRPVEQVSWYHAIDYCAKLTERERLAGRIPANSVYRLPTEAEWEYACRGWTSTRFSYGDDPGYTILTNYAWYRDNNIERRTHSVGQKLPNSWGLHDMHGNIREWCQDWFGLYPGGLVLDPQGLETGWMRVFRGGYWLNEADACRSAARSLLYPDDGHNDIGFRAVLAPSRP